jgi:hypothetical protein
MVECGLAFFYVLDKIARTKGVIMKTPNLQTLIFAAALAAPLVLGGCVVAPAEPAYYAPAPYYNGYATPGYVYPGVAYVGPSVYVGEGWRGGGWHDGYHGGYWRR